MPAQPCHGHGIFCYLGGRKHGENTLAAISIVVEEPDSVPALNALLHEYAGCIIGRMGIPTASAA